MSLPKKDIYDMSKMMFLFFACAGSSPPPDPVDTSSYVVLWNDEPNRFIREATILPLEERMIVVRAILEDPNSYHTPQLCQLFDGNEKSYCDQLLLRSHIWEFEQIKQNQNNVNHPSHLQPEKTAQLEAIPPQLSKNCRPDNSWCIEEEAKQSIRSKKVSEAKGLCQSIQEEQAKEECFFQLAEEVIKNSSPSQTSNAMMLCAYSNSYQENCYAHIIERMADSYSELFPQYKEEISKFWNSKDKEFERQLLDYLETNFSRKDPSSKEISFIHRNSAKAYSFVQNQDKQDRTLKEWKEIFQQQKQFSAISKQSEIQGYWSPQRDRGHPYCLYLSLSYRPCSNQEERDLELALVAALLQQKFPIEKIREGQDDTIKKMLNKVKKNH